MTLSQNIQSKTKSPNAPLTKQDLRTHVRTQTNYQIYSRRISEHIQYLTFCGPFI